MRKLPPVHVRPSTRRVILLLLTAREPLDGRTGGATSAFCVPSSFPPRAGCDKSQGVTLKPNRPDRRRCQKRGEVSTFSCGPGRFPLKRETNGTRIPAMRYP